MKKHLSAKQPTYTPQQYKCFEGALYAFFQRECPQLGGDLSRRALVGSVTGMVHQFFPETTHLKAGQMRWTTIHRDENSSYGKKISLSRMTPLTLQLVQPEDIVQRANGKKLREIKQEAVARLFAQAYKQQGALTNAEVAILLKIAPSTVGKYAREGEQEHGRWLPPRGILHDRGPTLTHKREIIYKLFMEGKSVEQVQRETYHSPEAIHRYITAFKQILLCRKKGLGVEQTAFAVKKSQRLVKEYCALIDQMSKKNPKLDELLHQIERKV